MKKSMILLSILLLIAGCANRREPGAEDSLARKMFDALEHKNLQRLGECIVTMNDVEYAMTYFSTNTDEYQAMTLEEKRRFEEMFQQRIEQMQQVYTQQYEKMIDRIQDIQQGESINWDKIRYDNFETAFPDFSIEYMPRYGEYNLIFTYDDQRYRLRTDGAVKIHDHWKLQLGDFTLEAMDED